MMTNNTKAPEYMEDLMNSNMMIQEILNDLLIVLYTYKNQFNDNIVGVYRDYKRYKPLFLGKFSPK